MNRRISWVEWLAFGLIVAAIVTFFFGEYFLRLPLPSDDRTTAAWRYGLAPLAAAVTAVKIALVGLSLFLVGPLLRLKLGAPLWLILLAGVFLIAGAMIGEAAVCRPFLTLLCIFSVEFLGPILIVLTGC